MNRQYHSYAEIDNVQDRLRWCRHQRGLLQKDVAQTIGITRTHYVAFETGYLDAMPKTVVDKLAVFYEVPVDDLLDDYNRFLYYGQGKQIREYRNSLGLQKKPFARLLKVESRTLHLWETDQKRMFKGTWEKYFKGKVPKSHKLQNIHEGYPSDLH